MNDEMNDELGAFTRLPDRSREADAFLLSKLDDLIMIVERDIAAETEEGHALRLAFVRNSLMAARATLRDWIATHP